MLETIAPQPGPQVAFSACAADICIFGGGAGGGKTMALMMEMARWSRTRGFRGVLMRRTGTDITKAGGLADKALTFFRRLGARTRRGAEMDATWVAFDAQVQLRGCEHEHDVYDWQGTEVDLFCLDELTHFCLTPDHEVLTDRGWVPIADVRAGDKAWARVGAGAEFRPVRELHIFDYEGDLVEVYQRNGVSARMTPNHRVLVQRQDARRNLGFVDAACLQDTVQTIPRAGRLERVDYTEPLRFARPEGRGHGANANNADTCAVDVWLEFLGWYLSEGCAHDGGSPLVQIRQLKHAPDLADLMRRLPWRSAQTKGEQGWYVCSRQLHDVVKSLGNTYTKRVPRWVAERCSARQIELLLSAFARGDGHTTARGAVNYGLANRGLRDDLQELYSLCGRVATAADVTKGPFPQYRLNVSRSGRTETQVRPTSVRRLEYKGKVYCPSVDCPDLPDFTRGGYARPSVPGGNFLVRHRGRVHFTGNTEVQFWYLFSRLRSMSGIRGYMRASCNPDPDSWVRKLIGWWIGEDGLAIPERSGVLRWICRVGDDLRQFGTREECQAFLDSIGDKDAAPKSLTFIPSKLSDNPLLERANPGYRSNLALMDAVTRGQLLGCNWNMKATPGAYFNRMWFDVVESWDWKDVNVAVRGWDIASRAPTPEYPDPDYTVGALWLLMHTGKIVCADIVRVRESPGGVDKLVEHTVRTDGPRVIQAFWQDPGSAGVRDGEYLQRIARAALPSVLTEIEVASKNKTSYAKPLSAFVDPRTKHNQLYGAVVRAPWNAAFFSELEAFVGEDEKNDQVDASSRAYLSIASRTSGFVADFLKAMGRA